MALKREERGGGRIRRSEGETEGKRGFCKREIREKRKEGRGNDSTWGKKK